MSLESRIDRLADAMRIGHPRIIVIDGKTEAEIAALKAKYPGEGLILVHTGVERDPEWRA